jgi:hypothetical protein
MRRVTMVVSVRGGTTMTITEPSRTIQGAHSLPGTGLSAVPEPHRAHDASGFWIAAGAFFTATAFSTIPTSLYGLYRERDQFSSFIVTVVFAVYAGGHLSEN